MMAVQKYKEDDKKKMGHFYVQLGKAFTSSRICRWRHTKYRFGCSSHPYVYCHELQNSYTGTSVDFPREKKGNLIKQIIRWRTGEKKRKRICTFFFGHIASKMEQKSFPNLSQYDSAEYRDAVPRFVRVCRPE